MKQWFFAVLSILSFLSVPVFAQEYPQTIVGCDSPESVKTYLMKLMVPNGSTISKSTDNSIAFERIEQLSAGQKFMSGLFASSYLRDSSNYQYKMVFDFTVIPQSVGQCNVVMQVKAIMNPGTAVQSEKDLSLDKDLAPSYQGLISRIKSEIPVKVDQSMPSGQ